MVGNAAEEGLMQQLKNPSHTDPARLGALSAMVSGGIVWETVPWVISGMGTAPRAILSVTIGLGVGLALGRRLSRKRLEAEAARRAAHREKHRILYTSLEREEDMG